VAPFDGGDSLSRVANRKAPPDAALIVRLWVMAREMPELATNSRHQVVARVLLALHHGLARGEPMSALDAEARKMLRRAGKSHQVAWATQTAVDADAEIIRYFEATLRSVQRRLASGEDEDAIWRDWVGFAALFLEPFVGKTIPELEKLLDGVGSAASVIKLTPTALARKALRLVDPQRDLKNFAAGTSRRTTPTRSRKR
jgi:hypothetical protein